MEFYKSTNLTKYCYSSIPSLNDIIKFIKSLKSIFPNIIIERVDERYTSKISNLIIRQSGIKQKSRMNKSIIDKISASLILESYLTMINK